MGGLWWLAAAVTVAVDVRLPETGTDEEEETTGPTLAGTETLAWPFWPSTGFLERCRPLLMCLSQYF